MFLKNIFLFWWFHQVGLQELFSFKQKNPHVDLEPFLAQSSQYFRCVFAHFLNTKDHLAIVQVLSLNWIDCSSSRDYIERGLRKIEEEGCAVPISSIGGIGGECKLKKALLLHVFIIVTQKAPPVDLFSPRYVWHSSPKDICPLRQYCGWGITGLAATGDFWDQRLIQHFVLSSTQSNALFSSTWSNALIF